MSKYAGRKLTTPYKYLHTIFAFPQIEPEVATSFPLEALSFYKNPLGMVVTPDSESDSGRLVLNPIFGPDQPLWLRGVSQQQYFAPVAFGGWHFVPFYNCQWWRGSNCNEINKELLERARQQSQLPGINQGQVCESCKYLHFAKVQVNHTFPIDMLRYDRCVPLSREDGEIIRQCALNRRGGTVYLVQICDAKPIWWTDRWHSYSGIKFEVITPEELPENRKYG